LLEQPERAPLEIAQDLNLIQTADTDFLEKLVDEVLAANADKVEKFRKGKKGLLGFFVGEVMRRSKGKAEPKATNALLNKKLNA
jgi:aspartyl-tRNA(Asn)/glutamyl-tRNA(Gln) amidotransferase subunit B